MASVGLRDRKFDTTDDVDDIFEAARRIAENSDDPGATYAGILRGLEIGLSYNTLDPVLSKAIGNKLADMRTESPERPPQVPAKPRTIVDPTRRARRRAPRSGMGASAEFPTEWTLDPLG